MIRDYRHIAIVAGFLIGSVTGMAQEDDLVSSEAMLVEQQNINFQTFFFESLQQKAIGNFDKAIFALEACHNIDKENKAVLFELSKNYFQLFKYTEAEYYILKGLETDPENIYMLRHLKEIKTRQNDFSGAISIQNRIIALRPDEEADLVILLIKAGEIDKATALLQKLDNANKLPEGLMPLRQSLLQDSLESVESLEEQPGLIEQEPGDRTALLKRTYEQNRDYNSLQLLLERELKTKQYLELLKDSRDGLDLFPAQPYVYLMHAKALNNLRKYNEAIDVLENGLDYLIDDDAMKSEFMEQLSLSHKGKGNNKMATQYYQKALELKDE